MAEPDDTIIRTVIVAMPPMQSDAKEDTGSKFLSSATTASNPSLSHTSHEAPSAPGITKAPRMISRIIELFTSSNAQDTLIPAITTYTLRDEYQPIACMHVRLEPGTIDSPTFGLQAKSTVDEASLKKTIHLLLGARPSDDARFSRILLAVKFTHPDDNEPIYIHEFQPKMAEFKKVEVQYGRNTSITGGGGLSHGPASASVEAQRGSSQLATTDEYVTLQGMHIEQAVEWVWCEVQAAKTGLQGEVAVTLTIPSKPVVKACFRLVCKVKRGAVFAGMLKSDRHKHERTVTFSTIV